MSAFSIYLASQSPRRRELLTQIGIAHQVIAVDIDESQRPGELAAAYVQRLASEKAAAGEQYLRAQNLPFKPVLGADTAVVIDNEILGKPVDKAEGIATLQRLSGRDHEVITGIAVHANAVCESGLSRTRVWFRALNDAEIEEYWASGEPHDKAGAYGIQGLAAKFIERIEGSYSGVVGLPLFEVAQLLKKFRIA